MSETRQFYFNKSWQVLTESISGNTFSFVWGLRYADDLIFRTDSTNGDIYAMQDANFNCTAICDGSGTMLERYQFDPYGERTVLNPSWTAISATAYDWFIGHQGLRLETDTDLYNCRNRVYSPRLGRWMQRDPLLYKGELNLYGFDENNPIDNRDSLGLRANNPSVYCSPCVTSACCIGCCLNQYPDSLLACITSCPGTASPGTPTAPSCSITLVCRSIYMGAANHCFIVATSGTGARLVIRGGPRDDAGIGSSGAKIRTGWCGCGPSISPWGSVDPYIGPYGPGSVDWTASPTYSTLLVTGPIACMLISCLQAAANKLGSDCLPYFAHGEARTRNSNTFAREILNICGMYPSPPSVFVPGWSDPWYVPGDLK